MKIAVTYDNGQVFQHFGHTESFKIYEIEHGAVINSEIVSANGEGHDALAGFLAEKGVDALICGGIGDGAVSALFEAGIGVCPGAEGDADKAVADFISGGITEGGANCDHHHEEESCGSGCHECGHGCCGHHQPVIEGKNSNKKCRVHYRGTFNDGTQFDSSYDRGEPLEFICGVGMMIVGFDEAVVDMEVGEVKDVHLMPEQAYGQRDPNAVITVEVASLPGSENLSVGQQVYLTSASGQPIPVTVTAREGTTITFDANPEMAGKELNFHIELVSVE